ncbi:hypothetical protein [Phyllobacterium zundukense]|uniref:Uncharacterized protein n=1 Tax=Phyllobacterium zundukense TaxID=1867719 RepID=A0ACD4CXF4_9HYPH|nr:hypothetical protein [Phyllobacterium zundukense]UXN58275.1 hypothetical protein N8E88_05565 [Phyllobacterium zundukense]
MSVQGQSFNYFRVQEAALRLLDKFGSAGEIWRDEAGSGPVYDPGEPTIQKTPCTLAVLKFDNADIDGTLIKASDKKVYIAAKGLAIVPVTTDKLMIGGLSHTIVRVMPLNPAGTNVYFEVQARN